MFAAWMKDTTGSYAASLNFFVGLFLIAFAVSLLIRRDIRSLRELNGTAPSTAAGVPRTSDAVPDSSAGEPGVRSTIGPR